MAARKQKRGWAFVNKRLGKTEAPLNPSHIAQLGQFQAHRRLITLQIRG